MLTDLQIAPNVSNVIVELSLVDVWNTALTQIMLAADPILGKKLFEHNLASMTEARLVGVVDVFPELQLPPLQISMTPHKGHNNQAQAIE